MTSPDPAAVTHRHPSRVIPLAATALVLAAIALPPVLLPVLLTVAIPSIALADDSWNPFRFPGEEPSRPPRRPKPVPTEAVPEQLPPPLAEVDPGRKPPGDGQFDIPAASPSTYAPAALNENARGVEREELAPILASDGSGLPYELWRGLDVPAIEAHLAKLDIPPRSPTMHSLWRRLITSNAAAPGSAPSGGNPRFDGLRATALYRSGLVADAAILAERAASSADDPASVILAARIGLARGTSGAGCDRLKPMIARKADLARPLQHELLVLSGACAALNGNPGGAGIAAELLREEISRDPKLDDPAALAALDAAATQTKTPARGKPVTLLHYRLHQLGGGVEASEIARGEPALAASIALDANADPVIRIVAAEIAARLNALSPGELGATYRAAGTAIPADQLLQSGGPAATATPTATDAGRRASLFKAADVERTPLRKVRLLRALLDDAKRAGLYWQTLEMLGPLIEAVQPVPEIGWFAETAIEIALVSGQPDRGRQWAALGGAVPGDGGLRRWLPLIDLIDPALRSERGRSLASIEDLAGRGRLPVDLLHRLATVLDAHDINVPIPLWEATSKTPQPAGGYLPDTGILSELQDAAKKKEFGRTVLLVMRTLGPNGAEGANIIALGDSIRALRRAGLETEARRLSLEALFVQWPRGAVN